MFDDMIAYINGLFSPLPLNRGQEHYEAWRAEVMRTTDTRPPTWESLDSTMRQRWTDAHKEDPK